MKSQNQLPVAIDWKRYDSPTVLRKHGREFLERRIWDAPPQEAHQSPRHNGESSPAFADGQPPARFLAELLQAQEALAAARRDYKKVAEDIQACFEAMESFAAVQKSRAMRREAARLRERVELARRSVMREACHADR